MSHIHGKVPLVAKMPGPRGSHECLLCLMEKVEKHLAAMPDWEGRYMYDVHMAECGVCDVADV